MKVLLECLVPFESAPVFTLGLAKGLKENNVDVYALLVENIENKDEWFELLNADHIILFTSNFSLRKNLLNSIKELYLLKRKIRNIIFDFTIDTFPNGLSKKIYPFITAVETSCIDHDVIPHSSASKEHIALMNSVIRIYDNVIVLSKSYIKAAMDKYHLSPDHILYMRHGALEYPTQSKAPYYNSDKRYNYLYFGRIDGYKGLHVLSSAYKSLKSKHDDISLTVAGGGDFSEYEQEYCCLKDCVVINRYLDNEDICFYFNMPNTIVVLPYIDASQSGVISMALFYKTPIIVSDTGGLKEQLFDGEMGLFVEPNNSDDLIRKMESFILDDTLYKKQKILMANGYDKSTWRNVIKEFLLYYDKRNKDE